MPSGTGSPEFSNCRMRPSRKSGNVSCPHHGIEEWLIIQNFFHGLNQQAQDHVDAAAGGSFLSLDVAGANALIDKIASNQSWKGERQPARPRGVHQIDIVDMLAAKLELLMKKLESPHQEVNQVLESRMTCETCGVLCVFHSLPPPLVFIGGSHPGNAALPCRTDFGSQ